MAPAQVHGFNLSYRLMIRWKAGLLWGMPQLRGYEFVWLLDTDAFLLAPLTYDPFALLAASNASYGYVDVNVETGADGVCGCGASARRVRDASSTRPPQAPSPRGSPSASRPSCTRGAAAAAAAAAAVRSRRCLTRTGAVRAAAGTGASSTPTFRFLEGSSKAPRRFVEGS